MAECALVPDSSPPAPTSEATPTPAVPTTEAAVRARAYSGAIVPSTATPAATSSEVAPPANFLTPAEVEEMSLDGAISGVPTLADTRMALAPVSWDAPPACNGSDVHLVGVPASVAALRSGAKVYPGHGGLEVLLCFESLDTTDLRDLDRLMGGDVADCLLFLRPRVAPTSLAAEVSSIAGHRELAALLGQFPLDRLAERMINSFSFIRRFLAKIRHLQAASEAEHNGTLSSETLVARDNYDTMRREWTVMCRHWGQRVRSLEPFPEGVQKRKQSPREPEALQAKLPESSDDEAQDPSYELSRAELDIAAQAEAAADNDESSAEYDGAEPESKPAASHPSPAGPRESKTQKKSDKGSNSKSPSASSKFEYRSTKSPKARVLPKSGGSLRGRKIPVLSLATFLRRARVEIPSEGLQRIRSKLDKLNYDDLRGEHLDMVEAACRETHVSYRIFEILVKSDSYRQSQQGYPDFEPHKPDIHILKARWDLEAYQALMSSGFGRSTRPCSSGCLRSHCFRRRYSTSPVCGHFLSVCH
ncbi:hypothetical protein PHMEG_00028857 [Phytophthora megakarya]|uniref:Uncharacterized protein n=1 Tax=Phytophthora megakarya TaxID=4795 RepID=A0A225V546_9STRA|nr:hypothetical protein PHMEG_00028857 [Phytophthora megakarya]